MTDYDKEHALLKKGRTRRQCLSIYFETIVVMWRSFHGYGLVDTQFLFHKDVN